MNELNHEPRYSPVIEVHMHHLSTYYKVLLLSATLT
jgi:hypothetical protein